MWFAQNPSDMGRGRFKHRHRINKLLSGYLCCAIAVTSVLWHCWLGSRKGIRPVKNVGDGGGGHWLIQMEWRPAGWSMCLPLLISPCTIKSRSSLLAPGHPGGPGKRAIKRLWWCDNMHVSFLFSYYVLPFISRTDTDELFRLGVQKWLSEMWCSLI